MRILRFISRVWTTLLGITALALTMGLAARLLLPLAPWLARPALVAISPAPGAFEVVPRSSISLQFDQPMNRSSVEQALQIEPVTPGDFEWDAGGSRVTFRPHTSLTADMTYTVRLAPYALGRWWRALQPVAPATFRTARQPSVVVALPTGAQVAPDSPLALVFSQAMVEGEGGEPAANMARISIEPPLSIEPRWLDERTLFLYLREAMRPATTYTATLAAGLADRRGVELEQSIRWSWTTAWPAILERTPANGDRQVGPLQPLRFTLAQPLPLEQIRASLTISPAITGVLSAQETISGTQLITFTPDLAWQNNQLYMVNLADGAWSESWRFTVGPAPGIIGLFPGQGQILPAGQALRLRFSTPMEPASLQAALSIDPAVGEIPLEINEAEVRLTPQLAPSTAYTLTIAATARDRNDTPLGADYRLNLRTAPAPPALAAPQAFDRAISLPISRTATIDLEYVNLSAIDLALYRLDEPTLIRVLNFGPADWRAFRPERYNQRVQEQWRVTLNDPPDQLIRATLPLSRTDSPPLATGAYYLRARALEGPQIDLLLFVSPISMLLKRNGDQLLIWALEPGGAPARDQLISIYSGTTAVLGGRTDNTGLLQTRLPATTARGPLIALAGDNGLVREGWAVRTPGAGSNYAALLFTDRYAYPPGALLNLSGFARQLSPDGSITMPRAGATCRLLLGQVGEEPAARTTNCSIDPSSGIVSATLALDPALPPGEYLLNAQIGDSSSLLPLRLLPATAPFMLNLAPGLGNELILSAQVAGEPLAGAVARWKLRLDGLNPPAAAERFQFAEAEPFPPTVSDGMATLGPDGRTIIALPTTVTRTLAYALEVTVEEAGGEQGFISSAGRLRSVEPRLGIFVPRRVLTSNDRPRVELLARDADGNPLNATPVNLALYRGATPAGAPVLERRTLTNDQGLAEIELVQINPGEYRLVARLDGARRVEAPLFITRPGFTAWNTAPGQLTLVSDREQYRPGETAELLVAGPMLTGTALLTLERGDNFSAQVIPFEAGRLINIDITPEMAPATRISLRMATGEQLLEGSTVLRIDQPPSPLLGGLLTDTRTARPNAGLPITFTADLSATLLVAVTAADQPTGGDDPAATLRRAYQPAGVMARSRLPIERPAAQPAASRPPAVRRERATLLVEPMPVAGATPLPLETTLPAEAGAWRITAYAGNGAERWLESSLLITTSVPFELAPLTPQLLRPGDRALVALDLRSTTSEVQQLSARLEAGGLQIAFSTPTSQTVEIGPGERRRLVWEISAAGPLSATLNFVVANQAGETGSLMIEMPVLAMPEQANSAPGIATLTSHYYDPLNGAVLTPDMLARGRLVAVQTTLVVAQPLDDVAVELNLPGVLEPVKPLPGIALTSPEPFYSPQGILRFSATRLEPGIYQVGYLARVVASGDYAAPPPRLSYRGGGPIGIARDERIIVR